MHDENGSSLSVGEQLRGRVLNKKEILLYFYYIFLLNFTIFLREEQEKAIKCPPPKAPKEYKKGGMCFLGSGR